MKPLSSEVERSVGSPRRASFNRALKSVSPAASSWLSFLVGWCFPELSELFQSWACFSEREKEMFIQSLFAFFVLENVNCLISDTGNSLSMEERNSS